VKKQRIGAARKERLVALTLIICIAVVAFWEIAASRSRRAREAFDLTANAFDDFEVKTAGWEVRRVPISATPIEPNILAFDLRSRSQCAAGPIAVRVVHGYNMPDCMRIKQYDVELIADTRRSAETSLLSGLAVEVAGGCRVQVWRLKSELGDNSIWVTSMLRAHDFSETDIDVRSMAFPRIDFPVDPGWLPEGLTLRSLRHPVRNFSRLLRAKWNNSRADLATFLGLKQPAWASRDLLTLVACSTRGASKPEEERSVVERVVSAQGTVLAALQEWQRARPGTGTE